MNRRRVDEGGRSCNTPTVNKRTFDGGQAVTSGRERRRQTGLTVGSGRDPAAAGGDDLLVRVRYGWGMLSVCKGQFDALSEPGNGYIPAALSLPARSA